MLRAGLLGAVVIALDVLAGALGLIAAATLWLWWRPQLGEVLPFPLMALFLPNPFMPPGLAFVVGWLVALRSEGLYDPGQMTSFTRIARGLTRAAIMVCIGVVLLHFFLSPQGWSRALILLTTALMCTFTGLFRLLFFRTQARLPKPFAPVRVVIVGLGEDAAALSARISRYGHGAYEVAGFLRTDGADGPSSVEDSVLGDVSAFARLVNEHDLRMVVLTAFALGRQDALTLATRADQMGLKVFQVPFTWGAVSPRVDLARVGDLLKEKAWVHDLPDLTRTRPETLLSAQWRWVVPGERVGLTLRAVRLNATADGVSVFESFSHPRWAERVRRFHRRLSAGVAGGVAPALGLLGWAVVRSRRTSI